MGIFGKKDKTRTAEATYAQVTDETTNLPVATLVSEDATAFPKVTVPSSAPCDGAVATTDATKTAYQYPDPMLTRFPMQMTECPNCHRESRTRVTTAPTFKTYAATGCMFMVFWPLCWVPLVVDSCKKTEHFCVLCGAKVAKIEAFQDCCVEHRG
mmetsp:Transcript_16660/g.34315  ORF Transcript_16660/g.34315 Transcript_16660/m.34315 type:complete len:155 (+) Transcript_16660:308-772(+)|eukprot:CAMPEP_0201215060 /NCGR_PEP_ID=MMETSP0851-20130426/188747_1 /ASSEMBLY_ACC=CAM_ASM_000631 /TAXON_ID=183588 /ORGANISM="Pseudo-nitzschia fraudulenta, Strain WWA7" /LENGTH=154 /DNA_ID=CAMNT_0047504471 /DNA_START=656 /DNA_END=1120 /DNA_ORIENTATION=-